MNPMQPTNRLEHLVTKNTRPESTSNPFADNPFTDNPFADFDNSLNNLFGNVLFNGEYNDIKNLIKGIHTNRRADFFNNPFDDTDALADTHPESLRKAISRGDLNANAVGVAIAADDCDTACDGAHAAAALCASEVKRLDDLIERLHHPHAYIEHVDDNHPNAQFAAHLAYMRDTYEQTRQSLLDTCDAIYQLAREVAPLKEEDEPAPSHTDNTTQW